MAKKTGLTIHYPERGIFYIDGDDQSREVLLAISEALSGGNNPILLEHRQGADWIVVGTGIPMSVEAWTVEGD